MTLIARTLTITLDPHCSENGAAVKTAIGIEHFLFAIMVVFNPSQLIRSDEN